MQAPLYNCPMPRRSSLLCIPLRASASSESQSQLQDAQYKELSSSYPLLSLTDSCTLQLWAQVQTSERPCRPGHPCQNPPVPLPLGLAMLGLRRLSAMKVRASLIPSNPNIKLRMMPMAVGRTAGYQRNHPTIATTCGDSGKEQSY